MARPPFPRLPMLGMFAPVTDEMRDQALAKAKTVLARLDAIRSELGLPADDLGLVAETYVGLLQSIANEAADAEHVYGAAPFGPPSIYRPSHPRPLYQDPSPFNGAPFDRTIDQLNAEVQRLKDEAETWKSRAQTLGYGLGAKP